MMKYMKYKNCVKIVRIRSFSSLHFSGFGLNAERYFVSLIIQSKFREILGISPYSVRNQGNADQKNSEYGHFLRSEKFSGLSNYPFLKS